MKKICSCFLVSILYVSGLAAQNFDIQKLPPINGPKDVSYYLQNSSEAVYSIPPGLGNAVYVWEVPAGVHITDDKGTSITVTFDKDFVSGIISVKMKDKKHKNSFRTIEVGLKKKNRIPRSIARK